MEKERMTPDEYQKAAEWRKKRMKDQAKDLTEPYNSTQRRQLLSKRQVLIQYLLMKVDDDDFHAVGDAAVDIREVDAKLSMLNGS